MYSILLKTRINLRNLCIKGCFESKTMNLLIIDPIASAIWSFEIYRGFFLHQAYINSYNKCDNSNFGEKMQILKTWFGLFEVGVR